VRGLAVVFFSLGLEVCGRLVVGRSYIGFFRVYEEGLLVLEGF